NNDLISVLFSPANCSGHEQTQIDKTLLYELLGMLRLNFDNARLSDSISGGTPIAMVRSAQPLTLNAQLQEIGQILNPWLTGDPHTSPLVIPNPTGEGKVSIATLRLGFQDEFGVLVV